MGWLTRHGICEHPHVQHASNENKYSGRRKTNRLQKMFCLNLVTAIRSKKRIRKFKKKNSENKAAPHVSWALRPPPLVDGGLDGDTPNSPVAKPFGHPATVRTCMRGLRGRARYVRGTHMHAQPTCMGHDGDEKRVDDREPSANSTVQRDASLCKTKSGLKSDCALSAMTIKQPC